MSINENFETDSKASLADNAAGDGSPIQKQSDENRSHYQGRLWTYALHEDNGFGHRSDFFLLAHSMLVVAYAGLLGNEQHGSGSGNLALAARVVAIFGMLLSLAWVYVTRRQWKYSQYIYSSVSAAIPDMAMTFAARNQRGPSGSAVMVYVVPGLSCAMWLVLAIFV